jgi:hypothetical protein
MPSLEVDPALLSPRCDKEGFAIQGTERRIAKESELTLFRGRIILWGGELHDAENTFALSGSLSPAYARPCPGRPFT